MQRRGFILTAGAAAAAASAGQALAKTAGTEDIHPALEKALEKSSRLCHQLRY